MNENLNLEKILKYCLKGTKLYSPALGEVAFAAINNHDISYPIIVKTEDGTFCFTKQGKLYDIKQSECLLFPSREQRDWSKFTAPWYKKEKFDPKTLKAFDRVLVKISNESYNTWYADFVAEPSHVKNETPLILGAKESNMVIPYNDDTKHLVGTTEEAPKFYRYWED